MNTTLVRELYEQIDALPIVDVHTHVDWHKGTASNIGQILGYHYYTELTNSAEYQAGGFPLDDPRELTRVILPKLALIDNTVQYDWLMSLTSEYLGLGPWEWYPENWEHIYDRSVQVMDRPEWRGELIAQSNIVRVFLTNNYDEDLEGLDVSFYVPCLRTDPLALWMDRPAERERMGAFLGRPVRSLSDFAAVIDKAFYSFAAHGMGYAALSVPPNLSVNRVSDEDAQRILDRCVAGASLSGGDMDTWTAYAIRRLSDACRKYGRPFHLMIGSTRDVYTQGVPAGMDLFDSVNSMRGLDDLLNDYGDVSFPIATVSDTGGLELVAHAWIRHNVFPSGHWWYSNQPTDIAREIRRRIDAVPGTKSIGYFSDAYYLEFILPKFRMYKFELAAALAERMERSVVHPNMEPFNLDDALSLAEALLIRNPQQILGISGL